MKSWVYGCDECPNACPMNMNTWETEQNYPGPDELADDLLKKFWFIGPDSLWIWKVNALRAMANSYKDEYEKYFYEARQDEDERVAEMAEWAIRQQSM